LFESHRIWVSALIIDELCDRPSHWRSEKLLDEWLTESGIPAICGVDTRTLTKHIRESGTLLGKIVNHTEKLDKSFDNVIDPNKINLIKDVSISVSKFLIILCFC
jgi:carbamoylphosphate synthase small subunit